MKRRPGLLLIALMLSAGASAQTTPQQSSAPQKATIQGTVIKAGAGQPLKRARVSLRRTGNTQTQSQAPGAVNARLDEVRTTLEIVGAGPQLAQLQNRIEV